MTSVDASVVEETSTSDLMVIVDADDSEVDCSVDVCVVVMLSVSVVVSNVVSTSVA